MSLPMEKHKSCRKYSFNYTPSRSVSLVMSVLIFEQQKQADDVRACRDAFGFYGTSCRVSGAT